MIYLVCKKYHLMKFKDVFTNERPLYTTVLCGEPHPEHVDFHELDLDSFPLITDFKIVVRGESEFGANVYYTSKSLGLLSSFLNWDDVEVKLQTMKIEEIPLGTTEKPDNDIEQGWELDIWEKDEFVYVIEGSEPCTNQFEVWYRVRKEDYIKAWEEILALYK